MKTKKKKKKKKKRCGWPGPFMAPFHSAAVLVEESHALGPYYGSDFCVRQRSGPGTLMEWVQLRGMAREGSAIRHFHALIRYDCILG